MACAAAPLLAQAQEGTDPDEVLRVDSSLVRLNIGVVDRQGRPITDLTRNDFVVYEGEVRQTIQNFEPTQAPFSLVLMLDMSGSTLSFRTTLKQAALRFIDALGPEDRVAVVAFNKKVETLVKFTSDRNKIATAISNADGKSETRFYEALKYSLSLLSTESSRRKALVVLTDGLDTEMRQADRAQIGDAATNEAALAAVKPDASAALNSILNAADRQGVTIYPLVLPSSDPKRLAFPNPVQVAIHALARTRLEVLANRTGGRYNALNRLEDLGTLYAQVAADLRTLYSVTYQPQGAQTRSKGWRPIRIEVTRAELIARTRPGYFAR